MGFNLLGEKVQEDLGDQNQILMFFVVSYLVICKIPQVFRYMARYRLHNFSMISMSLLLVFY